MQHLGQHLDIYAGTVSSPKKQQKNFREILKLEKEKQQWKVKPFKVLKI